MKNLPSTKLRGLAGIVALAGCAALAMPAAQATPRPIPVVGATAKSATVQGGSSPQAVAATGWNSTTAKNTVRYNKLYNTPAIPASKCVQNKSALNTEAGVRAYDAAMVKCMAYSWRSVILAAGGRYKVVPTLVVHRYDKVNTACGIVTGPTSYYCSAGNGTIYIPYKLIASYWKTNPTFARAYATNTIAHEYGHHVQAVTGILDASWWRQLNSSTQTAKLEESRRRELQASCLGSAYIGANKKYYPMGGTLYAQWKYVVATSGDQKGAVRDHGSITNHNFWSTTGFYAASSRTYASRCNTFSAAASRVS